MTETPSRGIPQLTELGISQAVATLSNEIAYELLKDPQVRRRMDRLTADLLREMLAVLDRRLKQSEERGE